MILNRALMVVVIAGLLIFSGCKRELSEELSLEDKIDNIVRPRLEVGIMVGVLYDGERQVFSYGEKILGEGNAPDGDTIFEIGSITKTFTTTLLADLVLKGLIDLDGAVGDYLPAGEVTMPTFEDSEISFRHLATHTSALPRMPDDWVELAEDPNDPFASYTTAYMYAFLNRCTLSYRLGTQLSYSNLGVGLLGLTLSRINGTSYREMVTQRIFTNLGMSNSSLFLTDAQRSNLAVGYDGELDAAANWNATDCFQGAGFIKSSVNDMFLYVEANLGLLSTDLKDAIELAHEPVAGINFSGEIGLGWFTDVLTDGQRVVNHNGATSGYTSYVGFNKAASTGVIVLCNSNTDAALIGAEILRVLPESSSEASTR
ncbi:MAG: beta-lactamase family protein [bacterium]|nr:beta-lactamase family protein [bacterium]